MSKWIYVVAVWALDSAIGFHHAEVEAETKDDAYRAGFELVRLDPGETRVNDYVIALPVVAR